MLVVIENAVVVGVVVVFVAAAVVTDGAGVISVVVVVVVITGKIDTGSEQIKSCEAVLVQFSYTFSQILVKGLFRFSKVLFQYSPVLVQL